MSPWSRRQVENAIENLIDLLDTLDGDPDVEREPVEDQGEDELSEQAERQLLKSVVAISSFRKWPRF